MLKPRQCVREMREYDSPIEEFAAGLRLDLNENTSGCSPRVINKLRAMDAKTLALYTPREPGEKLVADFVGVAPAELMLTNGGDEAIDLLCRAYLETGVEMIIITPAFSMYEIFAQTTGATVVRVPAGPELSFPTDNVIAAINPRTRIVVITNPNNPTGVTVSRGEILRVVHAAPDAAVLVDEAYFDFYGQTMMDQVGKIPNLFVARTFSKAYGLAGLRLGILAGHAEQMPFLRPIVSPFNVNAGALACLAEALADRQHVAAYVHQVKTTREWLRAELESLRFKCWPSETNFLLCRFGALKPAILQSLKARGISLRDRPDCEACVRISIGTQAEMEGVLAALKQALAETSAAWVER